MATSAIKDLLTNKAPAADNLLLRDIHLAEQAGYWPLAPGWWILIVLLLVGGMWLSRVLRRRARFKKSLTQISPQLSLIEEKLMREPDNEVIAALNTLLRQIAVNYYPRADIASLTGVKWLAFLDQSGDTTAFSRGVGQILGSAPYQTNGHLACDQAALMTLVKSWVNDVVAKGRRQ